MKIKAILFDMDGVLIEAKEWHYEALNRALKLFGMPISRFDHLTSFDGLPTLRKLELLTLERGLPKELHVFINEMKQKFTMEIVHASCKPMFIHEYTLSSLKDKGYKLAVCSNSVRNTVETMMQKSALSGYLDFVMSNEDVSRGKPDPEMYVRSMEHFALKPTECLIIEDNENGIKAARASGGHLLVVKEITEVNLSNIINRISEIEGGVTL
jgi:HAD superfamily hydrolase (TIGR01509 family)